MIHPPAWPGAAAGLPPLPFPVPPPSAAGSPSTSASLDPVAILRALKRRWVLASFLGLLSGALAAGATYAIIPSAKYTATASLHVSSIPPRFFFHLVSEDPREFGTYRQSQAALITSDPVIEAALDEPAVAELDEVRHQLDAAEWLKKNLRVGYPTSPEYLEVSLSGDRPQAVATIVNAVVTSYYDKYASKDRVERQERQKTLEGLWKQYQEKLATKRAQLNTLVEAVGSDSEEALDLKKQFDIERQELARKSLSEIRAQMLTLRASLEVIQAKRTNQPETEITEAEIENELLKDPEYVSLQQHLRDVERYFAQTAKVGRDPGEYSRLTALQERNKARKSLDDYRKYRRSEIESQLQALRVDGSSEEQELKDQLARLDYLQKEYIKDLQQLGEESKKLTHDSRDLGEVQDRFEAEDKTAKALLDEIEHLEIEIKAPQRVSIFQLAKEPRNKDESKASRFAAIAGLGAFVMAVAGLTFWEIRSRRIASVDDVVAGLGIRLVGSLPPLPPSSRRGKAVGNRTRDRDQKWKNLLVESVDATRTMLVHATRPESLRVVMITSANVAEGKTSLSGHLVTSLARSGWRTLLIDCDLRRPSSHRLCDLPLEPGFCDYLRGELDLADIVKDTVIDNLWMITAGVCDEAALAALARRDLRAVFETLKEEFDYIIIDSAPVLPIADTLVVGQHVDAVIFSIMNEVSRIPEVLSAYERVSSLGIRVLGAVMAGTHQHSYYRSSYGYQYVYAQRGER
jgi:capsular exopolysaccharide synthesis family protein